MNNKTTNNHSNNIQNSIAIDTTTDTCVLGLRCQQITAVAHYTGARQHAAHILIQIDQLLTKHACDLITLHYISVSCGPGSFTGVRLGMSVAQGLAHGLGCPIVPLNSLQALAQTAYQQYQATRVMVAMQARRDQCYWGVFSVNSDGIMQVEKNSSVLALSQLALPTTADTIAIGNAWQLIEIKEKNIDMGCKPLSVPSGEALLVLGDWLSQQGESVTPSKLMANYGLTDLYQPKRR